MIYLPKYINQSGKKGTSRVEKRGPRVEKTPLCVEKRGSRVELIALCVEKGGSSVEKTPLLV